MSQDNGGVKEMEKEAYDRQQCRGILEYKNIYEALKATAERLPGKTAVISEHGFITYREMMRKIDLLAEYLKWEFGIRKGDRVGLLFVNSIDFYLAVYAVTKIGAIAVMVNTKMQTEEIAFVLEDTQTRSLIMNLRWMEKVQPLIERLGICQIMTEKKASLDIPGVKLASMEAVMQMEAGISIDTCVRDKDLTAVILHTSGTTGNPKGIMVTHTNILEASYGYEDAQRLTEKDITVISVPIFHILALSCVSTLFFYIGGTIVVFERFDSNSVLEAIEKYHATHFHSVPAVYLKMMEEASRIYDLTSLRTAVCGGAIISEENKQKFYEMAPNAAFRIAYGLTETAGSGVMSFRHGDPGKAVCNCKLWVRNTEDNSLMEYGEGEAVFEGPIVATRVWGRPGLGGELLYTGDIIRKEKNGHVFVLDRIKDLINRGGEKLFPSTIEHVLAKYPGVEQASVFPVSHEILGEVPAAVLVAKEGMEIDLETIKADLPKRLGKFEIPQYLEVWEREQIPVTGNGKVRKKRLRELLEERTTK